MLIATFGDGDFRCIMASRDAASEMQAWARMDSNHRRHKPTGLQPVSFGHSDTRPMDTVCSDRTDEGQARAAHETRMVPRGREYART